MLTRPAQQRDAALFRRPSALPGLTAAIALAASASAAQAFDATGVASKAWSGFKTACAQAISDPQGYINGVAGRAPAGMQPVGGSPDGRVVTSSIYRDGVEERVHLPGYSDRLEVICYVSSIDAVTQTGLPSGMAEQFLDNPQLMNDPNFLAQLQQDLSSVVELDLRAADTAIGAAFTQIVTQDPGTTIAGGAIPVTPVEDYFSFPGSPKHGHVERNYQGFAIETRLNDIPVQAFAEVQYGHLWVVMTHSIEAGQ